jgi:hypothetical protein
LRSIGGTGGNSGNTAPQDFFAHQEYTPIHSLKDFGKDVLAGASNFGAGVLQTPYAIGTVLTSPKTDWEGIKKFPQAVSREFHDPWNLVLPGMGTLGHMAEDVQAGKGAEVAGNQAFNWATGEAMGPGGGPSRSVFVPAAETRAEKLMQAILPPEGLTPGNVRSAMREAPAIREFGMRTGNPLKTIPQGIKASEGVAGEGLEHYRSQILEPNAGKRVTLENNMSPSLGHTATLGQIDKRISDINDLIRGATKGAKSAGAEMTALERQGLENEVGALRSKLYGPLSESSGIPPEDIQALREGYGGQYTIKNALESGHYNRLTKEGFASQGGNGVPLSKPDLISRAFTALRGGPEAIANRQFARRIAKFEPEAPFRPMPRAMTPPEEPVPINEDLVRRLNPVPDIQGHRTPPVVVSQGPMAKAPAVAQAEQASKAFQEEQNKSYAAKRAAREATKGTRLQRGNE